MLRLAPRIGVSLLVTLLFGPLNSTAHDSDDESSEGRWSVIVAGHITWTGEDHQDCVHRATVTNGRCVHRQRKEERASNRYCPEVTPGFVVHCVTRTQDDSDR
jgi:hypothetical protein